MNVAAIPFEVLTLGNDPGGRANWQPRFPKSVHTDYFMNTGSCLTKNARSKSFDLTDMIVFLWSPVCVLTSWSWLWRRRTRPCVSSVYRSFQTYLRPSPAPASKPSSGKYSPTGEIGLITIAENFLVEVSITCVPFRRLKNVRAGLRSRQQMLEKTNHGCQLPIHFLMRYNNY